MIQTLLYVMMIGQLSALIIAALGLVAQDPLSSRQFSGRESPLARLLQQAYSCRQSGFDLISLHETLSEKAFFV